MRKASVSAQIDSGHAVELFSFGLAVVAVALNFEGAVIGHKANVANALAELPIGALKAIAAFENLRLCCGREVGFTREHLNDTAGRVAVELSQRPR
jgi:hypothetical protein